MDILKCLSCNNINKKLYTCKQYKKCTTEKIYCKKCKKNVHNKYCGIMNSCIICKKISKLYFCDKLQMCTLMNVFCKSCLPNHEKYYNICNNINKCICCGLVGCELYECQKNKKCINIKLFCNKCKNEHKNKICKFININAS